MVGRPSQRDMRDHEALPEGREAVPERQGGVGRPFLMARRGREALLEGRKEP